MAPLDTAGWAHNGSGEIVNGQTRSPKGDFAFFVHSQELQAGDVWRMRVEGGCAWVALATEQYNVEKHVETYKSTASLYLGNGMTRIYSDISQDGERHHHPGHLKDHIPDTKPYDVALRITKDGSLPQIQFNDDSVWHDFAPEGGTALKAGPWFPYLMLTPGDHLTDLHVHRSDPCAGTRSCRDQGRQVSSLKSQADSPPAN
jgi:hypothetical protein